jgi:hypothetical protein
MSTVKFTWSLLVASAMVTAACGDSKSSMNPVAPSAVVLDGPQSEGASSAVSGPQAKGGVPGPPEGKGPKEKEPNGQAPTNTSPGSPSAPGLKKVEIEGKITVASGNLIIVSGQQVVVGPACVIRHGQTPIAFGELASGDRVHVRADRVTTTATPGAPATTTLECREIIVQNPGDGEGSGDDTPTLLVSVMATDAFASELPVETATFTLTRSGNAASFVNALTVNYTISGTAGVGDFAPLSGTVTFAAGSPTATVVVTPVPDAPDNGETVVLTLTSVPDPYDLGSPVSATATITDTNAPLVSVTASDPTAREATLATGTFRFTRSGSTAAALTVSFSVSGSATSGTDYQPLPPSVTFPIGQSTVELTLTPLKDGDNQEGDETVIVTVTDGATYDVGASSSATVTISQ